jgi:hypothetical protein
MSRPQKYFTRGDSDSLTATADASLAGWADSLTVKRRPSMSQF